MARPLIPLAVLCCTLAACGGGSSPSGRLDRLGFFDYTPKSTADEVKGEGASDAVFDERTRRFYAADAETLAEGGAGDLVRRVGPLLRRLGVPPLRVRDDYTEAFYTVYVNDRPYPMYTRAELESETTKPGVTWGLSAARTVALLNNLLARAGSKERAWGYAGGNDFSVFILTPDLRSAVAEIVGSPQDAPYRLNERYPSFGLP